MRKIHLVLYMQKARSLASIRIMQYLPDLWRPWSAKWHDKTKESVCRTSSVHRHGTRCARLQCWLDPGQRIKRVNDKRGWSSIDPVGQGLLTGQCHGIYVDKIRSHRQSNMYLCREGVRGRGSKTNALFILLVYPYYAPKIHRLELLLHRQIQIQRQ